MRRVGQRGAEHGRARRAGALWLMLAGGGLWPVVPTAQAQQQIGQHSFDIPAQPLGSALAAFSDTTGIQFFFDSTMAAGRRSSPVSGSMSADAALARLLTGTGLTYRHTNASTVTLAPVPQPQSADDDGVALPQIDVNTTTDRGWSPVRGYVARVSSTATRTDTPIIETPQSVSVVTRDQMDDRAVRNLSDALAYTAGAMTARMGTSSSFGGDSISLRGFGGDGSAGASSNEFLDGMRLLGTNFAVSGIDPWLLERVDVLRGPASVLFGQITPGGLINMISRRPSETAQGEVRLVTGTGNRREMAFDTTGPLNEEGTVLYRVSGIGLSTDLQATDNSRDRVAVAPSLTWRPTAETSLTLLSLYQRDTTRGSPMNYLPAAGTALWNPNGRLPTDVYLGEPEWDRWNRTVYAIGYLLEHAATDWLTLRNSYRYLHNDLDLRAVYRRALAADYRTLTRSTFTAVEAADLQTVDTNGEIRFTTGPATHTVLLGTDYRWLQGSTLRGAGTAPTINIFAPVYGQGPLTAPIYQSTLSTTQQLGFYAQDQVRIDQWALQFGLRQDFAVWSDRNRLTGATSEQSAQALTGRAGLVYLFDFGLAPYASYSESFDPVSGVTYDGSSLQPTRARQYEVGVKYQPPGAESLITLAAFDLTQTNRTTADPTHTGYSIQTGEVRIRGLEVEAVASLGDGLALAGSYTLLDSEVTQSNDGNLGRQLAALPRNMASLWLRQTWQDGALAGLMLGAGVRYVGRSYGDNMNTFSVQAHTLVDFALRLDMERVAPALRGFSLSLNATNLFDTRYVSSCTTTTTCYWGNGRNVQLALGYRW